ncbi:MAG: UDP-glucose/GDP-mannose dehydrogenase family protein [Chloroflexi bacterium]|nr:UDP-glucose/GDP-mannose dehydrogenase family protein [Chloroflexota bacterium]
MKVSIFGLGYVGTVSAACLAGQGHEVLGVDVSADKVNQINNKQSPIVEPGLEPLIQKGVETGKLKATQDTAAAVRHGEVLLICVGTPSHANGGLGLTYVERVAQDIGQALAGTNDYKVVSLRSTVLPGTFTETLKPILEQYSGKKAGVDFGVTVNPEFLREGSAIEDFINPPYTLIGAEDEQAGQMLARLYENLDAPLYFSDPDTANMVKYACNAFHAVKVTFANEIGRLSKVVGVDSTRVMEIFTQDTKLNISPRYLRPGFAFGGSCLPKDLRAINYLARHTDVDIPMLEGVMESNHEHIEFALDMVVRSGKRSVTIVGLSFKPHTDDLRESPMVTLTETLLGKGYKVTIYDANVNLARLVGGNRSYIEQTIPHVASLMSHSLEEAVAQADVIIASHGVNDDLVALAREDQLVVDLSRNSSKAHWQGKAMYEGLCW